MAVRKYASDYRLETRVLPNGKAEKVRIYQGPQFVYCAAEDQLSILRKRVLLATALVLVGLLPLLFNNTLIGRTAYVMIPAAFALLPWYLVALAGWRLGKFSQPMTREEKDLTDTRLRVAAVWLAVLMGLTFAGCVAYCFIWGVQSSEWLCIAGVALGVALSVYLLTQRKKAETKQAEAKP